MSIRALLAISVPWFGLSMLADGLSALLLPYLVLQVVGRETQATVLGLATFAGFALGMAIQPLAGAASDSTGTRRPLLLGGLIAAVLGLATMGATLGLGMIGLVAGYLLAVSGANAAQAAQQALIPDSVTARWRGRAAGLKGLMDVGGAFVAFAILAALLADGLPVVGLIVLGAGLAITVAPAMAAAGSRQKHRPDRNDWLSYGTLWRGLQDHTGLIGVLASRFLVLLGIYAVGRFLVLFMEQRLGLDAEGSAAEAGIILAVLALLTAVASVPAGWAADRIGRRPLMVGGALGAAVGIGLLPLATESAHVMALGIPLALGTAAFGGGSWALATDLVPREESARFMGIANYATAGAAGAAGLLGPIVDIGETVAAGLGYDLLFILAAVMAAAGGLIALRLPEVDYEGKTDATQA